MGSLETIGGAHSLSGKHPFDKDRTHTSDWFEGEYFYADRNRKGQYFVLHDGYWHLIENPIIPKRRELHPQNPQHNEQ